MQKSNPQSNEINAADNGTDTTVNTGGQNINIIREKTFNEELKKLVSRISENENTGDLKNRVAVNVSSLSDEEFLAALHSLFYQFKYIQDMEQSTKGFDPFALYIENEDDINSQGTYMLKEALEIAGIYDYAMLSYDLDKKGYSPFSYSLKGLEHENLIISLRDELYKNIYESGEGYILTSDEIIMDNWLSKIFRTFDADDYNLYFIKTAYLTSALNTKLINKPSGNFLYNDSILMLRLKGDYLKYDTNKIFEFVQHIATVPVYLTARTALFILKDSYIHSIDQKYALLEYFFLRYSYIEDTVCAKIKTEKYYDKEIAFLIKYIISKLNSNLWEQGSIIHVSNNLFLVFSRKDDKEMIDSIIKESNQYYESTFFIDYIEHGQFKGSMDFIDSLLY